jgi:hypothetical protein
MERAENCWNENMPKGKRLTDILRVKIRASIALILGLGFIIFVAKIIK